MMWILILTSWTALTSGYAKAIEGNYCGVAREMYFKYAGTIDWLAENDPRLLAATVSHNEVRREFCYG